MVKTIMTFDGKIEKVTRILEERGLFDTDPKTATRGAIEEFLKLEYLDKIATPGEVVDILTVMEAEQCQHSKLLKDISVQVAATLFYLSDIKTISQTEPDLARGCRDSLWRAADLAQTQLEATLKETNPEELEAWLDNRS